MIGSGGGGLLQHELLAVLDCRRSWRTNHCALCMHYLSAAGMSLSDYARKELARVVSTPTAEELFGQAQGRRTRLATAVQLVPWPERLCAVRPICTRHISSTWR